MLMLSIISNVVQASYTHGPCLEIGRAERDALLGSRFRAPHDILGSTIRALAMVYGCRSAVNRRSRHAHGDRLNSERRGSRSTSASNGDELVPFKTESTFGFLE